eukprot:Gb_26946 [translate_table: standard]
MASVDPCGSRRERLGKSMKRDYVFIDNNKGMVAWMTTSEGPLHLKMPRLVTARGCQCQASLRLKQVPKSLAVSQDQPEAVMPSIMKSETCNRSISGVLRPICRLSYKSVHQIPKRQKAIKEHVTAGRVRQYPNQPRKCPVEIKKLKEQIWRLEKGARFEGWNFGRRGKAMEEIQMQGTEKETVK